MGKELTLTMYVQLGKSRNVLGQIFPSEKRRLSCLVESSREFDMDHSVQFSLPIFKKYKQNPNRCRAGR